MRCRWRRWVRRSGRGCRQARRGVAGVGEGQSRRSGRRRRRAAKRRREVHLEVLLDEVFAPSSVGSAEKGCLERFPLRRNVSAALRWRGMERGRGTYHSESDPTSSHRVDVVELWMVLTHPKRNKAVERNLLDRLRGRRSIVSVRRGPRRRGECVRERRRKTHNLVLRFDCPCLSRSS